MRNVGTYSQTAQAVLPFGMIKRSKPSMEGFVRRLQKRKNSEAILSLLQEPAKFCGIFRFRFYQYLPHDKRLVSVYAVGYPEIQNLSMKQRRGQNTPKEPHKLISYLQQFQEGHFVYLKSSFPEEFWNIVSKKPTFILYSKRSPAVDLEVDFETQTKNARAKYLIRWASKVERNVSKNRVDIPLLVLGKPIGKLSCDFEESGFLSKSVENRYADLEAYFLPFVKEIAPLLGWINRRFDAEDLRRKVFDDVARCSSMSQVYEYLVNQLRNEAPFTFEDASVFTFAPDTCEKPPRRALVLRRSSFPERKPDENVDGYLITQKGGEYYSSLLSDKRSTPSSILGLTPFVAIFGESLLLPDIRPSEREVWEGLVEQIGRDRGQPQLKNSSTIRDRTDSRHRNYLGVPIKDSLGNVIGVLRFVGSPEPIDKRHQVLLEEIIDQIVTPTIERLRRTESDNISVFFEKAQFEYEGGNETVEGMLQKAAAHFMTLTDPLVPQNCKRALIVNRFSRVRHGLCLHIVCAEQNFQSSLQNRYFKLEGTITKTFVEGSFPKVILQGVNDGTASEYRRFQTLLSVLNKRGLQPRSTIFVPITDEGGSHGVLMYISQAYEDEAQGIISTLTQISRRSARAFSYSLRQSPRILASGNFRHDCNKMLESIISFYRNADELSGCLGPFNKRDLQNLIYSLQRMFEFEKQILQRPDGRFQQHRTLLEIEPVLTEAANAVRIMDYLAIGTNSPQQPVSITVNVDSPDTRCCFDSDILFCVAFNLMRNAAEKPSWPENRTEVSARYCAATEGEHILLTVRDHGKHDLVRDIRKFLKDEFYFFRGFEGVRNFGLRFISKLLCDIGGGIDVRYSNGTVVTVKIPAGENK